jgi:hypothetical protein
MGSTLNTKTGVIWLELRVPEGYDEKKKSWRNGGNTQRRKDAFFNA